MEGTKLRSAALLSLLLIASTQTGCQYGFPKGRLPEVGPVPSATTPTSRTATYTFAVHDIDPEIHTDPEPLHSAFTFVMRESGAFRKVTRVEEFRRPLEEGNRHFEIRIETQQSASWLPHRMLSILTFTLIPMWGDIEHRIDVRIYGPSGELGSYELRDGLRNVYFLFMALAMVPDAFLEEGNYSQRYHRNLFRNLVTAARTDGVLR